MRHRLEMTHLGVFAGFLIAWTIALLVRVPHESAERVLGNKDNLFLFAKSVHICAYAYLTVLGGTVAMFGRRWWWVLPGLVLHGGLTEFLQNFTGRTGRIEDVGLDSIGIALGTLAILGWRQFMKSRDRRAEASNPEAASAAELLHQHPTATSRSTLPTSADRR
jgi:hypothetical protein